MEATLKDFDVLEKKLWSNDLVSQLANIFWLWTALFPFRSFCSLKQNHDGFQSKEVAATLLFTGSCYLLNLLGKGCQHEVLGWISEHQPLLYSVHGRQSWACGVSLKQACQIIPMCLWFLEESWLIWTLSAFSLLVPCSGISPHGAACSGNS